MMKSAFNFSALFVLLSSTSSCLMFNTLKQKQFTFYKNEKEQKLVFRLPNGKAEEKFRIGINDAKEQFYYFGDGSVFYVSHNTTWQTVNKHRIDLLDTNTVRRASAFNGKDKDGLFWKEISFEGFKIGYAYVASDHVERFDNSLNSVKIR